MWTSRLELSNCGNLVYVWNSGETYYFRSFIPKDLIEYFQADLREDEVSFKFESQDKVFWLSIKDYYLFYKLFYF